MATTPADALEGISNRVWERLATLANKNKPDNTDDVTADQIKKEYEAEVEKFHKNPPTEIPIVGPERPKVTANGMVIGPYEIPVVASVTVGISGNYESGDGSDWTAGLNLYLKVAGRVVWKTDYTLSPENYYVEMQPNVGIAKADVKIGLFGKKLCFTASGNACYWWFGFRCTDFDQLFFCIKG